MGSRGSCKELYADYYAQGTQLVSKGGASPFASRFVGNPDVGIIRFGLKV